MSDEKIEINFLRVKSEMSGAFKKLKCLFGLKEMITNHQPTTNQPPTQFKANHQLRTKQNKKNKNKKPLKSHYVNPICYHYHSVLWSPIRETLHQERCPPRSVQCFGGGRGASNPQSNLQNAPNPPYVCGGCG